MSNFYRNKKGESTSNPPADQFQIVNAVIDEVLSPVSVPRQQSGSSLPDAIHTFLEASTDFGLTDEQAEPIIRTAKALSEHQEQVGYASKQRLEQIYAHWRDEEIVGTTLGDVVAFVSSWMTPSEVFSEDVLIKWAENYGYRLPVRRFEE